MKKMFALFLGAVMTVSLSSCCCCALPAAGLAGVFGATNSGSVDNVETEPSYDFDDDFDIGYNDNDGELSWEDEVTTTTTTTAAIPDREFAVGSVVGSSYESRLLGLGCYLPGWTYYGDEQMYILNGVSDATTDTYPSLMAGKSIFYDMCAIAENYTDNINVVVSKLDDAGSLMMDFESSYADSFSDVQDSLNASGYTNISYEVEYVTISGQEYFGVLLTADLMGTAMYQRQFTLRCNEDYIATVTITTLGEDTTMDVLNSFYTVY